MSTSLFEQLKSLYVMSHKEEVLLKGVLLLYEVSPLNTKGLSLGHDIMFSCRKLSILKTHIKTSELKTHDCGHFARVWLKDKLSNNCYTSVELNRGCTTFAGGLGVYLVKGDVLSSLKKQNKSEHSNTSHMYVCTWDVMVEYLSGIKISPVEVNPCKAVPITVCETKQKIFGVEVPDVKEAMINLNQEHPNPYSLEADVQSTKERLLQDVFMSIACLGKPLYQEEVAVEGGSEFGRRFDIVGYHSTFVEVIELKVNIITAQVINDKLFSSEYLKCIKLAFPRKKARIVFSSPNSTDNTANTLIGLLSLKDINIRYEAYDVLLANLIKKVFKSTNPIGHWYTARMVADHIALLPNSLQTLPLKVVSSYSELVNMAANKS